MTALGTAAERHAVLRDLLAAVADLLIEPQVYTVRASELQGDLGLVDGEVRVLEADRRLPLDSPSVVCRAAQDGIPYLGPVALNDPCIDICSPALLGQRGLVALPVVVAGRTVCVVLGHPRDPVSRELRNRVDQLAGSTVAELGMLLVEQLEERATHPYGHPAVGQLLPPTTGENEGAGGTHPYGHPAVGAREEQQRPPRPAPAGPRPDEVQLLTQKKPEPPAGERRTSPRVPLRVQVSHISEHNFFTGFTEDVSQGGLFIATHKVFKVGHRFELELALPGQPVPWVVQCEVRWVRVFETTAALIPGMGVRFLDLTPEAEEQIRRFMRKRPPLLHTERKP